MEEQNETISSAARLKQIKKELRDLRERAKMEKIDIILKNKKDRENRDLKIKDNHEKIVKIQKEIFNYNKLGKIGKGKCDVFANIIEIIKDNTFDAKDFIGEKLIENSVGVEYG